MNENYLHFLWKSKRLPFHLLKTCGNKDITIKNIGTHNTHESGPDFLNGRIILDGLEWCGNIELHIKSSDWYAHKHQFDSAYDNVILHVVYKNDRDVFINGRLLPTLELKQHIDWSHFDYFERFSQSYGELNCAKSLMNIDTIYLDTMLDRTIVARLNRKIGFLASDSSAYQPQDVLYLFLARAFGSKVNQLPFEELTFRLPLSLLKRKSKKEQYELVLQTSGIYQASESGQNHVNCVAPQSWKRKGLRPKSFPEIRVKQFATLVSYFDFNLIHFMLSSKDLREFIDSLFVQISKDDRMNGSFSTPFVDLIVINCIVPFLWWYGEVNMDSELKEKAIELLQITRAEKNSIIACWRKLGVLPKSAFETQALIELYSEYCCKNKCLSCEVGMQVLKS